MKIIDMIKISIKEFYKNKSNYLTIFFMAISISLVIFCLSFSSSLNSYWNKSVKKMADYRTFFVYYNPDEKSEEEALKELKSYKNIESISPYTSYIINMRMFDELNNNTETNIFLFGVPKDTIKITYGENFEHYNSNDRVMICPEEIFYEVENDKKALNLINSIGKNFSLKFIDNDTQIEEFKLIGTYDSSTRQGKENFCYTNSDVVSKLNLYYQPEAFEEEDGVIYPLIVRIDSTDNINKTLIQFEKDHFYTNGDPVVKIDTTIGDKILNLVTIISLLVIIISIILSILVLMRNKYKQNKKYAILKTLGYAQSDNIKLQCIESFFCTISTLLLMLCITYLITFVIQNYYIKNEAMLYGLNITISKFYILIGIFLCVLSNISLILFYNKQLKNQNIMEEIKN